MADALQTFCQACPEVDRRCLMALIPSHWRGCPHGHDGRGRIPWDRRCERLVRAPSGEGLRVLPPPTGRPRGSGGRGPGDVLEGVYRAVPRVRGEAATAVAADGRG